MKWTPFPAKIRILYYFHRMSRILHIESATAVCSIAFSENGILRSLQEAEAFNVHGEKMTRLIERGLEETGWTLGELDAVALSAGPGSYTALRVGAATAKGICYALEKPLIKVDTLQAIAGGMVAEFGDQKALYCPMIDARRMEVYTAVYSAALEIRTPLQAMVVGPESFGEWEKFTLVFAGDGAAKCRPVLKGPERYFLETPVSARLLIPLAQAAFKAGYFEDVAYFSPTYLKPPNITQSRQSYWGE